MKYKLTTSISAKCGLLTSKVNFVVATAYCYALRATYFITQRAEAHLLGATQRKNQPLPSHSLRSTPLSQADILNVRPIKGGSTESLPLWGRFRGGYSAVSALCVKSSALQCQCVESIKRQWQTCLMVGF